jgi:chaperonin cofactor prefoldin
MAKSKYYYDYTRNIDEAKEVKEAEKVIQELKDLASNPIPNYYVGNTYGYEARKVVEDWDLSYNVGVAVSYLLRCNYKHDSPFEDIQKAINHLQFELDKLNNREQ